jgi:hypothetical protein
MWSLLPAWATAHTAFMTLKSAAFLAFIGTLILTVLLALDFFNIAVGVSRSVVPVITLLRAAIYLFAGFCVTVFFFVFSKAR